MHGQKGADSHVRPMLEQLEPRLLLDGAGEELAVELFSVSPALFVENQGQWADESVHYAFQGDGANVLFTDAGPVFQVFQREATDEAEPAGELATPDPLPHDLPGEQDYITQSAQFSVHFDGANAASPVGLGQAETYFNYFIGEQADWRSNVPAYETVAYQGLYDGIDLHTWGRRDSLKYEFHVAPGGDYGQIQVSYEGIDGLWIDAAGALHVQTALGELIDDAPYIYQVIDGERVEVIGTFELVDGDTYAFDITAAYDPTRELIIDPYLSWSTYLGGSDTDATYSVAADGAGGVYVTGYTKSAGWASGGFDTSHNGYADAFVAKFSASGGHLWSTYLGGSSYDYGRSVAADGAGGVYVTGRTYSAGWTSGGFDTSLDGYHDAFVAKLSSAGGHVWSTYLGGSGMDYGYGIALDGAGGVYVTGWTESAGWVSGGFDTSLNGGHDAFVARLSSAGGHLWSTYLGGSNWDEGCGVAADGIGGVYVTGATDSAGWASGGFDISHNGVTDGFVAKLSSAGGHLWSTYLGGLYSDYGRGVAADRAGGVYVTGYTYSPGWASGGFDTSHNGGYDAFVARLSSGGGHLWSTYLGASGGDAGYGIAADAAGGVYVVGRTDSVGWASGGFDISHNGSRDAFLAKLSSAGGHLWSSYLGGSDRDYGHGIATDGTGGVYVTGGTLSPGWASGGFDTSHNGDWDAFVAKITSLPVATDDSYGLLEDSGPNTLDVLANDSGTVLAITGTSLPWYGSVVIGSGGTELTYDPAMDFFGTDSFTYTVTDAFGWTDTATVDITVANTNDPPEAMDDSAIVLEDSAGNVIDVLANDRYLPDPPETLTITGTTTSHGTVIITGGGTDLTYTPIPGYYGPVGITYTISDGNGGYDSAIVAVTVELVTPIMGDANYDGSVNGLDYVIWATNYYQSGGWEDGDFTGDGIIDGLDYILLSMNYEAVVPDGDIASLQLVAASAAAQLPESEPVGEAGGGAIPRSFTLPASVAPLRPGVSAGLGSWASHAAGAQSEPDMAGGKEAGRDVPAWPVNGLRAAAPAGVPDEVAQVLLTDTGATGMRTPSHGLAALEDDLVDILGLVQLKAPLHA